MGTVIERIGGTYLGGNSLDVGFETRDPILGGNPCASGAEGSRIRGGFIEEELFEAYPAVERRKVLAKCYLVRCGWGGTKLETFREERSFCLGERGGREVNDRMRRNNSVVGASFESVGLLSLLRQVTYFLVSSCREFRSVFRETRFNFIIILEPLGRGT